MALGSARPGGPQLCRFAGPVLLPFVYCPAVTAQKFLIIFKQGAPILSLLWAPPTMELVLGLGPSPGALGIAEGDCSSFAWHSRPFPIQCPDNLFKHPRTPQPWPEALPHTFPPLPLALSRP